MHERSVRTRTPSFFLTPAAQRVVNQLTEDSSMLAPERSNVTATIAVANWSTYWPIAIN